MKKIIAAAIAVFCATQTQAGVVDELKKSPVMSGVAAIAIASIVANYMSKDSYLTSIAKEKLTKGIEAGKKAGIGALKTVEAGAEMATKIDSSLDRVYELIEVAPALIANFSKHYRVLKSALAGVGDRVVGVQGAVKSYKKGKKPVAPKKRVTLSEAVGGILEEIQATRSAVA
ncbi:hypothetical protein HOD08_01395 [bacterium]|nr:hypothetical protein [bacterium]